MDTILVMVIGLLPVVSAVIVFASNSSKTKNNINLRNGNMGWPIIGQTLSFLKAHRSTSMANFLEDQCSRYGKVFKCHLFGSATIVSCDYELNLFILQNEEKLFPASYPKAMKGILGTSSLLMTSGELHRKLRGIIVSFSAMSKSNPSFLHSLQNIALSMMDSWKDYKEIAFHKQVKKFALDLMLKTLLSIEPEEPLALKILQDFLTYMKGFVSLPVEFPGSHYSKAVKARARLSSTVGEIIKGREEEKRRKGDFLEVILSKEGVSDEEKVSIVLDILLAGYETSSTLISLIVYFLGHSPLAFQSFKKEHQSIRKSKAQQDKYLDFQDYQKMEFTQNVINEAMRCGNIVKFVHRKATQDVKYKEYVIPCGWKVLPILAAAHFDTSLHQNPFDFDPWRWTNSKKVIMPFGGGPRLCPGAELAKVETAFFLHHLVLNYRWKVKLDDFPMAYPYVEFQRGLLLGIEAEHLL
ncbi:cytochrome P450 724B1-like [Euphorbia lathyris]|uniref:cytochrome P450 724B1-like n=1 Tax=Euphorbia lathyris TaxID=212925 RepID=UPI00331317D0